MRVHEGVDNHVVATAVEGYRMPMPTPTPTPNEYRSAGMDRVGARFR